MSRAAPRVLVIPPSYFARDRTVGGGERYAMAYASALAERVPTTLGLFDLEGAVETRGKLEIRTFRVRKFDQRFGFPMTLESLAEIGRYDVVHSMVFPTPLTDLLALASRLRRQTLVLTDVGGGGPSWSTYLKRISARLDLNRLADGLGVLSEHAGSLFEEWRQPKVTLYGGVDDEMVGSARRRPEGYALFVGRLLPHKGVLELIQALRPETALRVVGRPYDADYLGRLQAAAEGKRVEFSLEADDAELRRQYAGASVVLQPSLPTAGRDTSELLGLVTLEAMASAKPVVVTRAGSLPELVDDGVTGFIVPPGDGAALRAAVDRLVGDDELSMRMGAAAQKVVRERFTWDRVAVRGLALYERAGAGRHLGSNTNGKGRGGRIRIENESGPNHR